MFKVNDSICRSWTYSVSLAFIEYWKSFIWSINNCEAIIFTSANAIKFLDTKEINKKVKCFCVGLATEKQAKSAGFQNIISAEGNVRNLKELILQNFIPSEGKIVYVSGEIISSDLDQQLMKEGYFIKRLINYKSIHKNLLNLIKKSYFRKYYKLKPNNIYDIKRMIDITKKYLKKNIKYYD